MSAGSDSSVSEPVLGLATFSAVCLDATDVRRVADFWATVLGHAVRVHEEGYADLSGGDGPDIWVNPVPEPKTVKDRLHLDLVATDRTQAEEVERLLALGATRADVGQADDVSWVVLADPEGNEFCVLRGAG